jgi:hypothetical protein
VQALHRRWQKPGARVRELAFCVPASSRESRSTMLTCGGPGIGSMDAVRTGLCAGAGTGRHERRGAAVHHPDKRTEPPDTDQPRTPRQAARLHVLPPAVREHPQGEKVRLGRRLSASGLQLHGASLRADQTKISRWNNGDPGFANVTAMDPDLFRCPYLRMQNAANYDFTPKRPPACTTTC